MGFGPKAERLNWVKGSQVRSRTHREMGCVLTKGVWPPAKHVYLGTPIIGVPQYWNVGAREFLKTHVLPHNERMTRECVTEDENEV
jgi:hypothetical protein